jgi:putative sigma-54 modulation protein
MCAPASRPLAEASRHQVEGMSKGRKIEDAVKKLSHRASPAPAVARGAGAAIDCKCRTATTLFLLQPSAALLPWSAGHPKGSFMNLTISGHHLEVTPALREYVLTKLDRVTRHFDQVVDVTVLLCVEKLSEKERRQRAEVTLHVKGKDIFVECASEDLYAAIDQLMDKLDRQVVRHKSKVQDHHHASPKRTNATLN